MRIKYHKAFELYWDRARFHVRGFSLLAEDQQQQIVRIGFNCWRQGQKYEQRQRDNRKYPRGDLSA